MYIAVGKTHKRCCFQALQNGLFLRFLANACIILMELLHGATQGCSLLEGVTFEVVVSWRQEEYKSVK